MQAELNLGHMRQGPDQGMHAEHSSPAMCCACVQTCATPRIHMHAPPVPVAVQWVHGLRCMHATNTALLKPHRVLQCIVNAQGSGLSEGEWVTLGAHEVEDLAVAVAHVRERHPDSTVGLWGRSMGAVTALLYAQRDPSIAGVVRRRDSDDVDLHLRRLGYPLPEAVA